MEPFCFLCFVPVDRFLNAEDSAKYAKSGLMVSGCNILSLDLMAAFCFLRSVSVDRFLNAEDSAKDAKSGLMVSGCNILSNFSYNTSSMSAWNSGLSSTVIRALSSFSESQEINEANNNKKT